MLFDSQKCVHSYQKDKKTAKKKKSKKVRHFGRSYVGQQDCDKKQFRSNVFCDDFKRPVQKF